MPKPSTTSLKLDSETKERIQRLAAARRRSPHWVMREAIEQYVEREEKREQFRQGALAAWTHYQTTGLHATAAQLEPTSSSGTEEAGSGVVAERTTKGWKGCGY